MKLTTAAFIATAMLTFAGIAQAQCPSSLTAEQMIECITMENAGYFYPNPDVTESTQTANAGDNGTPAIAAPSVTTAVLSK